MHDVGLHDLVMSCLRAKSANNDQALTGTGKGCFMYTYIRV